MTSSSSLTSGFDTVVSDEMITTHFNCERGLLYYHVDDIQVGNRTHNAVPLNQNKSRNTATIMRDSFVSVLDTSIDDWSKPQPRL